MKVTMLFFFLQPNEQCHSVPQLGEKKTATQAVFLRCVKTRRKRRNDMCSRGTLLQ